MWPERQNRDHNNNMTATAYKPAVLHRPHPDSKLCQDFHWVPYPLGLLPYDSWYNLHNRAEVQPYLPFRCPVCRKERQATAHTRKVFLVAERLTWEEGFVSVLAKDLNEELNWKFNFELGILDPFVEEPYILGGKNSRINKFYPYQNGHEMGLALQLMFTAENITETSWALWIGTQLDLEETVHGVERANPISSKSATNEEKPPTSQRHDSTSSKMPEVELIDLTGSPEPTKKPLGLPTPSPSTGKSSGDQGSVGPENDEHQTLTTDASRIPLRPSVPTFPSNRGRIVSYKTLQDFYCLLDKIERTSFVGALYLEAYAEKLRDDMCQACWFKHNVRLDLF